MAIASLLLGNLHLFSCINILQMIKAAFAMREHGDLVAIVIRAYTWLPVDEVVKMFQRLIKTFLDFVVIYSEYLIDDQPLSLTRARQDR